jgi:integrase
VQLEQMRQELQSELVALEAQELDKYPAVEVIEAAHPPVAPFAPPYWRDAGWVLLAAVAAGLCAILLLEFLTRRPRETGQPGPVTGIRVFSGGRDEAAALEAGPAAGDRALAAPGQPGGRALAADPVPRLPGSDEPLPRELIPAEVSALWSLSDPMTRQLLALLLSGLTLEECADLSAEDFDLASSGVRVAGPGGERRVALAPAVRDLFTGAGPQPLWSAAASHPDADELSARIGLVAHDAGLAQPDSVTDQALRHTYIAHLVRQGARLTELERVIGAMAPSRLRRYAALAPAGPAKSLDDVDRFYPLPAA